MGGDTCAVASFASFLEVNNSRLAQIGERKDKRTKRIVTNMSGNSVVPQNDGVRSPLHTSLVISALVDVVV